jgi:hypothetical protein
MARKATKKPTLLSSGNPQIQKGYGDGPVQEYIAAMPGWKSDIGQRVDEIVGKVVPTVQKAVKWNTPLYGKDDGYFMSMYCYKNFVQLAFMQGSSLQPVPPIASKVAGTRYLNIYEEDELDEAQIEDWVMQASKLPGERL